MKPFSFQNDFIFDCVSVCGHKYIKHQWRKTLNWNSCFVKLNECYCMKLSLTSNILCFFRTTKRTLRGFVIGAQHVIYKSSTFYILILYPLYRLIRFLIFIVITNSSYNEVIHHSLQWYWIIVKFYIYSCAIYDIGIRLRFGF